MKGVFKHPGSKWAIAQWVIDHFPDGYERMIYVEPFAGSLAVFFNKAPSSVEVINDLDSEIVNLFRVLRERPEDLKRMILLTPYSREEYDLAFEAADDPLEKARRFMVRSNMGIGSRRCGKSGWQCCVSVDPGGSPVKWSTLLRNIEPAAIRLRGTPTNLVHIENCDAIELIKRFNKPEVLMYLDPPYLRKVRKSGALYQHEMDETSHAQLLEAISGSSAKIILSGYDNEFYNSHLPGWHKDSTSAKAFVGDTTETIWMNYEPSAQMGFGI